MATRALRLLLGLLLAAGCRESSPPAGAGEAPATPSSAATAQVASTTTARRPRRRHYFARTTDRCEVYTAEGDTRSSASAIEAACPEQSVLARGERIRISGKTCMRESPADPSREVPVICPGPLIERDRDALGPEDGGP